MSIVINRRDFLVFLAAGAAQIKGKANAASRSAHRIANMMSSKKIFAMAWIDPTIKAQKGQELLVAKFPMALVTQDIRKEHVKFKNIIRGYNKNIVYLPYHMVIEETTVPGPGHDIMRGISGCWLEHSGVAQYVLVHRVKRRRIFDPRKDKWKEAFLRSCVATMNSYDYDGLFLDQCTIYRRFMRSEEEFSSMKNSLREVLQEIRRIYPNKILIGNSKYIWPSLNGQLNENRPQDYGVSFSKNRQQYSPRINLASVYTSGRRDEEVRRLMLEAHKHGAWFCSCENPQKVSWNKAYDGIIS